MVGLLLTLIIFALIASLAWYAITLIPLPQPFKNVLLVLVILILIVALAGMATGHVPAIVIRD